MRSTTDIVLAEQSAMLRNSLAGLRRALEDDDNWRALAALESVGQAAGGVNGAAWMARRDELVESLSANPIYGLYRELERALDQVSQHLDRPEAESAPVVAGSSPEAEKALTDANPEPAPPQPLSERKEIPDNEAPAIEPVEVEVEAESKAIEPAESAEPPAEPEAAAPLTPESRPEMPEELRAGPRRERIAERIASLAISDLVLTDTAADATPAAAASEVEAAALSILAGLDNQELSQPGPASTSDDQNDTETPSPLEDPDGELNEAIEVAAEVPEEIEASTDWQVEDFQRSFEAEVEIARIEPRVPPTVLDPVEGAPLAATISGLEEIEDESQDGFSETRTDLDDAESDASDNLEFSELDGIEEAEVSIVPRAAASKLEPELAASLQDKEEPDPDFAASQITSEISAEPEPIGEPEARSEHTSELPVTETLEQRLLRLDQQSAELIAPPAIAAPLDRLPETEPLSGTPGLSWFDIMRERRANAVRAAQAAAAAAAESAAMHSTDTIPLQSLQLTTDMGALPESAADNDYPGREPNPPPARGGSADGSEPAVEEAEVKIVQRPQAKPRHSGQPKPHNPFVPPAARPAAASREAVYEPLTTFGGPVEEASVEIVRRPTQRPAPSAQGNRTVPAQPTQGSQRFIKALTGE